MSSRSPQLEREISTSAYRRVFPTWFSCAAPAARRWQRLSSGSHSGLIMHETPGIHPSIIVEDKSVWRRRVPDAAAVWARGLARRYGEKRLRWHRTDGDNHLYGARAERFLRRTYEKWHRTDPRPGVIDRFSPSENRPGHFPENVRDETDRTSLIGSREISERHFSTSITILHEIARG